jgi:hypothetical protein
MLPFVIIVQKRYVLPGRCPYSGVSAGRCTYVLVVSQISDPSVIDAVDKILCTIRRRIIYNDDFNVLVGLRQYTSNSPQQEINSAICRYYNTN